MKVTRCHVRWSPPESFFDDAGNVREPVKIGEQWRPLDTANGIEFLPRLLLDFRMLCKRQNQRQDHVRCRYFAVIFKISKVCSITYYPLRLLAILQTGYRKRVATLDNRSSCNRQSCYR